MVQCSCGVIKCALNALRLVAFCQSTRSRADSWAAISLRELELAPSLYHGLGLPRRDSAVQLRFNDEQQFIAIALRIRGGKDSKRLAEQDQVIRRCSCHQRVAGVLSFLFVVSCSV